MYIIWETDIKHGMKIEEDHIIFECDLFSCIIVKRQQTQNFLLYIRLDKSKPKFNSSLKVYIYPIPLPRSVRDTRSILKEGSPGLNYKFSLS